MATNAAMPLPHLPLSPILAVIEVMSEKVVVVTMAAGSLPQAATSSSCGKHCASRDLLALHHEVSAMRTVCLADNQILLTSHWW